MHARVPVTRAALSLPSLRNLFVLAAAAPAWGLAAYALWSSSVVPQPHLSGLEVHRYFTSAQLARASSYSRVAQWIWIGSTLTTIATLALYAVYGPRLARRSEAARVTTGMFLGIIGVALEWMARLPFALLQTWWDRRHGLVHMGYFSAVASNLFGIGDALVVVLTLFVVMVAACRFGERWWLIAVPTFTALTVAVTFATPYALPNLKPLRDAPVAAAARSLEAKDGIHIPVDVESVRSETSLANSEAVGLGPSRRIVVWNTLLGGRFSVSEIRFVIAHELGHQMRNHLWKSIAWTALFFVPTALFVLLAVRRRGGMSRPEAIPLALLALVLVQLALLPGQNAVSRHMEQEADWIALRTTHDPAAGRSLFVKLATTSDDEPNPPT